MSIDFDILRLADAIGRETDSYLVVAEDRGRGGWVRVAHVGQNLSLVGGDAGGGKGASVFRLHHAGADNGNAGAVGRDGLIDGCGVAEVTEEVVASCDTAGAGSGEVGGVGVAP